MPSPRANEDDLGWNIGRYTVYGEIASGGMATVHIGRMVGDASFAKLVAVKRLHGHLAKDPEFLEMFLDEVRLAARIRHPNVVQPLDVVVTEGEVFLVMEYIHGESLARLLRSVRQHTAHIPLKIASAIVAGALNGLHAAHEAKGERGEPLGIVHRDVSPQNVMVGVDGVARVLDFGVAKATGNAHNTQAGELKGKLSYMAPEQLKGKPATRRSDIYAASIVLWECLTGTKLFDVDATSVAALVTAQANVPPPSSANPAVPREIDAVVLKGLAMSPDLRYATALEMADELIERCPAAAQQQVGQWVESTAKAALVERTARIEEIERTGADTRPRTTAASLLSGGFSKVSELSASHLVADESSPSAKAAPERKLVVPSARPSFASRPSAPPAKPPPATAAPAAAAVGLGHDRATPDAPFPIASSPSLAPPEVPLAPAAPARVTVQALPGRKRSLLPYVWIAVGAALIVLVVAAPEIVRRRVMAHAESDGLTLAADSFDVSLRSMRVELSRVALSSKDVPGVSIHAEAADATLSGLEVDTVTLRNVSVVVDGRWGSVEHAFLAWAAKHPEPAVTSRAQRLRVEDVHVTWNGAFGPGTKVDGSGVLLEIARVAGRPLGADGTLVVPAATIETPIGALGPWRLEAARESSRTKATLLFDAGAAGGPSATVAAEPDGRVVVDAKFARARLLSLGVPLVALGQRAEDGTKLDLALHLDLATANASGSVHVGLYDARFGGSGPTDVALDARFSGPTGAAIAVGDGSIALASRPGPLAGVIAVAPAGVRVELSGRPVGCSDGATFGLVVDTQEPAKSGGGVTTKTPCKPR